MSSVSGHVLSSTDDVACPYVFVVSCPRSGTTLLQRMLDHHPKLTVSNDTHFIPRALEKTCRQLIDRIMEGESIEMDDSLKFTAQNYRRFVRMDLDTEAVDAAAAHSSTYREFVSALYAARGAKQGKRLSGEKTPTTFGACRCCTRCFRALSSSTWSATDEMWSFR